MIRRLPDPNFWAGKKVLITGHSGFKGSWLSIWLNKLGADITGISLEPITEPNLFSEAKVETICRSEFLDICNLDKVRRKINDIKPELVIHMAAQPLVKRSYKSPRETFEINVMGTVNILESIKRSETIKVAIMITTDKVYKNYEDGRSYKEEDALGGHDPYSASKAASEIVIESYRKSFLEQNNVSISSSRAGNVLGGGDWSEDRLIPDAIKSWKESGTLDVRSPNSVRPWQHVLEPLLGYLILAEETYGKTELAGSYNFGPFNEEVVTVKEAIELANKVYGKGNISYLDNYSGYHEASLLSLNAEKAISRLNFQPQWSTKEAIKKTITWYKRFEEGDEAFSLCLSDVETYETG